MLQDFTEDINGKAIAYEGNGNLKPAKCCLPYTKEHIEEIIKCKKDWNYFAEHYYHIVSLDEGIIKVKPRDYQKNIINNFIDNRFNIVLASRQCGKSTSYEIFCMWYILFNESKTIAILANKLETAVGILQKIKLAYELLPKFLQQGIKKWNEKSIELENGCRIIASATSSSAIRSKSCNVLIIDEMAFITRKTWDKFYSSVYPTISSSHNSKIILVSTPDGLNQFYKFWSDAIKGKESSNGNRFTPIRVDWWQVPGRDEKWKEETIANTSEREFASEYGNDFLGSSLTLLESHIINSMVSQTPITHSLKINTNYKKFINIYELPQDNHTYVLGLDSAEMMEDTTGDSISIQLLDVTTLPFKQVASCNIREGITYFEVPEIAVRLAKYFNDAYMFIEANSTGLEVANMIESDFEYENVYHEKTLPGVKTTKKTKRLGCSNLKMLIEGGHLILNDAETISQLSTFIKKRNSYAADSGFLDDAVMSLMISIFFMNDKEAIDSLANLDFTKNSMKENIEDQGNVGLICGIIDVDGVINYEVENSTEFMDEWGWLYGK